MAERVTTVYGGHENDFVGEVSDRFMCQICTKVLREPHLAVCCGQHFCESCLNKWFNRQGRRSCPHCRAEGDSFSHVIHKGLRSEINQLKIKCSHHGEGCKWTGELGTLKRHLESENGCGFVEVECPNMCQQLWGDITCMQRKDLDKHLTHNCYLRPYQCEFCGLKDTYQAITGIEWFTMLLPPSLHVDNGHQAECPEVTLTCPNQCGSKGIKRKDMENHRSKCPKEPVECPFAEAGCKIDVIRRHQLEDHMTSSQQQHLTMVMKEFKWTKSEFREKLHKAEAELNETKHKLRRAETKISKTDSDLDKMKLKLSEAKVKISKADSERIEIKHQLDEALTKLSVAEDHIAWANKLEKNGDSTRVQMANFSEYHRSGNVWCSPPFYYREGYKMCLAVYGNGVGSGAGTHISISLLLLSGEHDDQLKWPMPCTRSNSEYYLSYDGYHILNLSSLHRPEFNEHKEKILCQCDHFCRLNCKELKLMNDCLTLYITWVDDCCLKVKIA